MDSEDRIENIKIENIDIVRLKDYFNAMDELENSCDDLVECFRKEQKFYLVEEKFNIILEEEAALVNTIYEIATNMKKDYDDILQAFEIRATERARRRRVEISRELAKKQELQRIIKINLI
ncbi:hypothetical protein ENUP19_0112G0032 [Entamoeba nuttalli]|uniref:Uncharacterized protein n=1 Tax=Entamoeba nuttalli TaxID=412467 RepID=A0ABQ0DHY6_9EUKA